MTLHIGCSVQTAYSPLGTQTWCGTHGQPITVPNARTCCIGMMEQRFDGEISTMRTELALERQQLKMDGDRLRSMLNEVAHARKEEIMHIKRYGTGEKK